MPTNKPNPSTIFFYYRVSSPEQASEGKHVLERYRAMAIGYGVPAGNIYFDVESGGKSDRLGFMNLCARLKAEPATQLVTPYHSRLHRSLEIWIVLRTILRTRRIELIDLSKGLAPVDLSSPDGVFMSTLDAAMAEKQRLEIQQTSLAGHAFRRAQGRANKAPFGYHLLNGKISPNHHKYGEYELSYWQAAQRIIEIYFEHENLRRTVILLSELWPKCTGRFDHPSSTTGLKSWLLSPALQGHTLYFGWCKPGEPREPHQQQQLLPNTHEPLLTPDQVATIRQKLKFFTATKYPMHPLAKLVKCGECGKGMLRGHSGNSGRKYFRCRGAYPEPGRPRTCDHRVTRSKHKEAHLNPYCAENLSKAVIAALVRKAEQVAKYGAEPESNIASPQSAELTKLEAQLSAIDHSDPDMASAIKAKEAKIAALKASQMGATKPPVNLDLLAQLQEAAADPEFWENMSTEARRSLFREFIESVVVSKGGAVRVDLRF